MTGCRRIKDMTAFLSQADVDRSHAPKPGTDPLAGRPPNRRAGAPIGRYRWRTRNAQLLRRRLAISALDYVELGLARHCPSLSAEGVSYPFKDRIGDVTEFTAARRHRQHATGPL